MIGNVFHIKDMESALQKDNNYDPSETNFHSQKSI